MNNFKVMDINEIISFIEQMPFNSGYAAIASDYEETDDNIEGEGWWSIKKIKYADAENLVFDYFGGGYPLICCIDGQNGEDTVEQAVYDFLNNNASFHGTNNKYVIDPKIEAIYKSDCFKHPIGLTDSNGIEICEDDIVSVIDTNDGHAILTGHVAFCSGAYGIETKETIDYDHLVSEIPQWCGAENSEHFSWCDNFISFWELMLNFGHEANCCSSVTVIK